MTELDHGARLTVVERAIVELQESNKAIASELKHISTVLARQGPGLMENARLLMTGIGIFAAVCTGIIYLAGNVASANYHALEIRMVQLEMRQAAAGKLP